MSYPSILESSCGKNLQAALKVRFWAEKKGGGHKKGGQRKGVNKSTGGPKIKNKPDQDHSKR